MRVFGLPFQTVTSNKSTGPIWKLTRHTNSLPLRVHHQRPAVWLDGALVYCLSDHFHILFQSEQGVESILIADQVPSGLSCRFFPVRYVIGEGAGGESNRPVFMNELTGYDYSRKLPCLPQKELLEEVQSIMESYMHASSGAVLSGPVDLYEYAW